MIGACGLRSSARQAVKSKKMCSTTWRGDPESRRACTDGSTLLNDGLCCRRQRTDASDQKLEDDGCRMATGTSSTMAYETISTMARVSDSAKSFDPLVAEKKAANKGTVSCSSDILAWFSEIASFKTCSSSAFVGSKGCTANWARFGFRSKASTLKPAFWAVFANVASPAKASKIKPSGEVVEADVVWPS